MSEQSNARIESNKSLAEQYFGAALQYANDFSTYRTQKRLIEGSEIDIALFYAEHKSLDGLKIRGIGSKTKHILEIILKYGEDDAMRIVAKERERTPKKREYERAFMPKSPQRQKKYDDILRSREK